MQHHPAGSPEPGAGPRLRVAALALLTVYVVAIAWLALRPLEVLWVSPANVEPLATIRADIDRGPEEAVRTIGAGMLRLVPLGVLLPLLGRYLGGTRFASLARTVFAGGMISLILEYLQSLVPSRVADVDSIILNTFGIAVAHQLAYGRLRTLVFHEPRPTPRRPVARRLSPRAAAAPEQHFHQARRVRTRPRVWAAPGPADRDAPALSSFRG
ncbi:VanZ family protein [Streptomyces sp. MP131-18]|uniref:VanZ family protein n=1 Tax=Streptomyces sp. MP131-18 TaxID=1857892 RepID=UPI00097CA6B6|nr:VanZ family protein [Streptomyces sp. MP131-18]ONK11907.1 putative integral membrane protein [Streptomyces sp. MP131-18]